MSGLRKMVDDLQDTEVSVFSRKSLAEAKDKAFALMYAICDRIEALEIDALERRANRPN